jgi:hypothetical protein
MKHSDHLAELSEEQYPFRNDRVSGASLISEFLVATVNLTHPFEQRSSTVCVSTLRILKAGYNMVDFTPFEQKEFDDGALFLFEVHCHFPGSTMQENWQNLTGL